MKTTLPALAYTLLLLGIIWVATRLILQLTPDPAPPENAASHALTSTQQALPKEHDGRAAATEPVTRDPVPLTRLDLTLRGLLATDDPKTALAIIQNSTNDEQFFSIGDEVFGLATLKDIQHDRVILQRNGHNEILKLSTERSASAVPTQEIEKTPPHNKQLTAPVEADHKALLEAASNPWQVIQWAPVMNGSKITGMKLVAEEEQEFLNRYGLELGDVITSINGHTLKTRDGLAMALKAVADGEGLLFGVQRGETQKQIQVPATHSDD